MAACSCAAHAPTLRSGTGVPFASAELPAKVTSTTCGIAGAARQLNQLGAELEYGMGVHRVGAGAGGESRGEYAQQRGGQRRTRRSETVRASKFSM
eukprot:scaffold4855_cov115-Isochrysis_galbana.AAC.3